MPRVDAECVVVGAGVVGLSIARALARAGREVVVLESEGGIGRGISSRNSEVVHAGLYYPPGSLKAELCVRGNALLYDYCRSRGVPHKQTGKLVVATHESQLEALRALQKRAEANGVGSKGSTGEGQGLSWLSPAEVGHLEPSVRCVGALLSPLSGIVDSHELMLSLQAEAEAAGAVFAFHTRVVPGGAVAADGQSVTLCTAATPSVRTQSQGGQNEELSLSCNVVINSAGLGAPSVARCLGLPSPCVPKLHLAKGSYFALTTPPHAAHMPPSGQASGGGSRPFSRLVYPLPDGGGLGVHATLDLSGRVRFGPDVEWVDREDYSVDPLRSASFYAAVRRYWPGLPDNSLVPDYSGIRPKLKRGAEAGGGGGRGEDGKDGQDLLGQDFCIRRDGAAGGGAGGGSVGAGPVVSLYGIESPGLTASLAIGNLVRGLVLDGS